MAEDVSEILKICKICGQITLYSSKGVCSNEAASLDGDHHSLCFGGCAVGGVYVACAS